MQHAECEKGILTHSSPGSNQDAATATGLITERRIVRGLPAETQDRPGRRPAMGVRQRARQRAWAVGYADGKVLTRRWNGRRWSEIPGLRLSAEGK